MKRITKRQWRYYERLSRAYARIFDGKLMHFVDGQEVKIK